MHCARDFPVLNSSLVIFDTFSVTFLQTPNRVECFFENTMPFFLIPLEIADDTVRSSFWSAIGRVPGLHFPVSSDQPDRLATVVLKPSIIDVSTDLVAEGLSGSMSLLISVNILSATF